MRDESAGLARFLPRSSAGQRKTGVPSMTLAPQYLSARIERQGNYFAAGVALERALREAHH
jgi:hypothetical protein